MIRFIQKYQKFLTTIIFEKFNDINALFEFSTLSTDTTTTKYKYLNKNFLENYSIIKKK